jgi:hypothetical protein
MVLEGGEDREMRRAARREVEQELIEFYEN